MVFPAWERKASQSLHQEREDPGSANNVMWALEKHSFLAWGLVSYLSPEQVVVWQSIQFQKHVDRPIPMEIQKTEATRMLQGTDLQEQSSKTGYSLRHSGKRARGGRRETRWWWSGGVTEPSSNCQQGGLLPGTDLGCGEALSGAESMQPDSTLWESSWWLPGPLFQKVPGSIQGLGNWHRRECSGAR